jgi:hypothetical protein
VPAGGGAAAAFELQSMAPIEGQKAADRASSTRGVRCRRAEPDPRDVRRPEPAERRAAALAGPGLPHAAGLRRRLHTGVGRAVRNAHHGLVSRQFPPVRPPGQWILACGSGVIQRWGVVAAALATRLL